MTTKTDDIKLPPLAAMPAADHYSSTIVVTLEQAEDAIRAAIEADRKRRGHPIAWVKPDIVEKQFINRRPRRVWWECNEGVGVAIYTAPQPAEPVMVPSDDLHTLQHLLSWAERQVCLHEETHRGGAIWEICDQCGAKWADDEGGRPEFKWPEPIVKARALLSRYGSGQPAASAEPDDFRASVKKLCIAARTSGGTAGRDEGLCAALDRVEAMLLDQLAASAEPVAEIYRMHYGNRMGNIGVNDVRALVAPEDMPPPGTKLYTHSALVAAQAQPNMPPLTDAMRAVLRNEHCAYDSEDALYAALCDVAQASAQDHDEALADTQRAIIEAAEQRGYARAEAENVGYRTDAERYRAMRAAVLSDDRDFLYAVDRFLAHLADRETPNIAEFDAAIDAARAGDKS